MYTVCICIQCVYVSGGSDGLAGAIARMARCGGWLGWFRTGLTGDGLACGLDGVVQAARG